MTKNVQTSEVYKHVIYHLKTSGFHLIFLSSVAQRNIENIEYALETSGNLVSQKCGHFEFKIYIKTIYNLFQEILKLRDFKEIYVEECGRDHKNKH